VPQYLQSDYADFIKKVDALITALKSIGSGDQIQKDQTTYNNKKKELDDLKVKVNKAIGDQQSKISDIRNSISEINKSGTKLNGTLKDKKEKTEQDLMKNITSFATNAQMIIVAIEPPAPIVGD
jgi:methyl-accepting chemotaxis protein